MVKLIIGDFVIPKLCTYYQQGWSSYASVTYHLLILAVRMTEAGQSALPRCAVAQNSQAHKQHLAPTKTLPKKWVVGIFYASLQRFYKHGLFSSDQIILCAPWALTQIVDITEVLLALVWIGTMQTGIILFSLGSLF